MHRMHQNHYRVYYRQFSPFAALGMIILGVAFFFLTLPIFLAALAIFAGFAAWLGWRIKKTIDQMEKEIIRQGQGFEQMFRQDDIEVIDVTPESDNDFYKK